MLTTQSNSLKPPNDMTDEQISVVATVSIKLAELGLDLKFIKPISVGPIISVYRFAPQGSTKVSQVEACSADLAIALGVEDVFVKRMPGESAIGVFVVNAKRTPITFLDTINNVWKLKDTMKIPLNFGVDHLGKPFVEDLIELPHLLVAGSTNSGKSTFMRSMLASLIYCIPPSRLQVGLSDTKNVEFGHFVGTPHLLWEPATSVFRTLEQLDWLCDEMESRLKTIGGASKLNIHEYNELHNSFSTVKRLPYIVYIIDELADLMAYKGEKRGESKLAEEKIGKIVQKSRASGIYLIAGTQRPSTNVVAGSIKANFTARLSFRLPADYDSRTVIGTTGAEHLLSKGDMLYVSPNRPGLTRLHSPYAKIEDIKAAVDAAAGRA